MSTHRVRGRFDCTSARHHWEENWSNRTTGYRSSGKRDANKELGKNGLHVMPQIGGAKAIYVAGRTPITVLQMGGRDLWMSFVMVENLDDSDQFIFGRRGKI